MRSSSSSVLRLITLRLSQLTQHLQQRPFTTSINTAMATTDTVHLAPSDRIGYISLRGHRTPESFQAASEILTDNHQKHHIFFNESGFHNHIPHNTLTMLSLGATPDQLKSAYSHDSSYQRPLPPPPSPPPSTISNLLSDRNAYPALLAYFKARIDKDGVEKTIHETFFAGTPEADDMLYRLFAGFVHPWIHLGVGVEFQQPAIVAEACALAAASESGVLGEYLKKAEERAKGGKAGKAGKVRIFELLEEVRGNDKIRLAAGWEDAQKLLPVMEKAGEEMVEVAAKFRVEPVEREIKRVVAEATGAAAAMTLLAQRPNKALRYDFYLMHSLTSTAFITPLLSLPGLPLPIQARILELKVRVDLILYASRRCPELHFHELTSYVGRAGNVPGVERTENPREGIVERALKASEHGDEGHVIKSIRALLGGAVAEREWWKVKGEKVEGGGWEDVKGKTLPELADEDGLLIKGDLWVKGGEMVIDSAEESKEKGEDSVWGRSVGFDEAWEKFGERVKYGEKQ